MTDHPSAPPSTVMDAVDLDEAFREQVEHYCTVTRYFLYGGDERYEVAKGMKSTTVEWSDVVE